MSRTPEPQGQYLSSSSTLDEEQESVDRGLVYRLKRQRGLSPVDDAESENTDEPAAKRLTVYRNDTFKSSICNVGLIIPSLPIEDTEDGTDNNTISTCDGFDEYADSDLDESLAVFGDGLTGESSVRNITDTADASFCLGESDEEAMEEFLKTTPLGPFQSPPSSVLKAHGRESRSADEFDPTLQYSSPQSSSTLTVGSGFELDQGVDWENVHEHAQQCPSDPSLVGSEEARRCHTAKPQQDTGTPVSGILVSSLPHIWATKSFEDMRLNPHKTFFHVKEMLQAKADMFKNQPDATFELFARVVYSSRENFHRRQYFQFRDLFKEAPPYLSGVLLG